jgi:tRNA(His) 5'-end guanylyltransferase
MINATKELVEEFHPVVAYTQSDEITLLFHAEGPDSQIAFDGRIAKMTSILAAYASAAFGMALCIHAHASLAHKADYMPIFDCRCWQVPNKEEAANVFLWREQDATRNSISMAAHRYFGAKKIHGVNTSMLQEMLFKEHNVNWNDYPDHFKRGSFVRRVAVQRELTEAERFAIPEAHRPALGATCIRSELKVMPSPRLASLDDKVAFIYDGDIPACERSAT